MDAALITIAAITLLGIFYVTLPIFLDAFQRYHKRRVIRCPETGGLAEVCMKASRAAASSLFGKPTLRVKDCTLWPRRKGCSEGCVKQAG